MTPPSPWQRHCRGYRGRDNYPGYPRGNRLIAPKVADTAVEPASPSEQAASGAAASSNSQPLPAKTPAKREVTQNACRRCRTKKTKCSREGTGKMERCSHCTQANTRCEYSPPNNKVELQKENDALRSKLEAAEDQVQDFQELLSRIHRCITVKEVRREIQRHEQAFTPEAHEGSSNESLTLSLAQAPCDTTSRSASIVSPFSQDAEMMFSPITENTSLSEAQQQSFQPNESMDLDPAKALMVLPTESYAENVISPESRTYRNPPSAPGLAANLAAHEYISTLLRTSGPDQLIESLWQYYLTMLSPPCTSDLMKFRTPGYDRVPVGLEIGGDFVCVDSLVGDADAHDHPGVPQWGSDFLKPLQMHSHVKLALAVIYTRFMRWLVRPTLETYSWMPAILRPTTMEILTPHAATTYMAIISLVGGSLFDEHKIWPSILERHLRFRWPEDSKIYAIDCVDGHYKITSEFERHAGDFNSWFFDKQILEEYPDLMGQVQVDYGSPSPEEGYEVIASGDYLGLAPKVAFQ